VVQALVGVSLFIPITHGGIVQEASNFLVITVAQAV